MNTSPRSSIADRLIDRPAGPPPSKPATGDTVTIACRLGSGVVLSVYRWEDFDEPTPSGHARSAKRAVEIEEKRVVLKGWSQPNAPSGTVNPIGTASGFGLTHGVDRSVWESWL